MLYVKQSLRPYEFRPAVEYPEQTWCKMRDVRGNELFIGVVYRSPAHDNTEHTNAEIICDLLKEMGKKNIVLLGDFNYGNIDWGAVQADSGAGVDAVQFLECMEDNFLTQHVAEPTRGASILDLVITSDPHLVHDIEIQECLSSSDHNIISGKIDIERNQF